MTARRVALAVVLALLGWQAAVGLAAEANRLRATSLLERRDALSLDASWRYRNSLGVGADWLEELRPHLGAGDALVVFQDGSKSSARLAAGFAVLLFPRKVRVLEAPPDLTTLSLPLSAGAVVAHLGPRGRFTESLTAAGLVPLVEHDDFQLLSRRPTGASRAALPPSSDSQRLHGWPLLSLLALPLLSGLLALRALGVRPRSDPCACWGWAWMLGCLLVGLGLLAWMLLGLRLSALTPGVLGAATAAAAVTELVLTLRSARGRASAAPCAAAPPGARWERVVFALGLGLALALVTDRIVLASGRPIVGGDEAGIWAGKAKALWAADGLGARFGPLASDVAHPDYPLLDPLLQVFSFALAQRSLDFENRLLIQLCVPALLLVAAGALRRCVRPAVAGVLLLLLGTARQSGVSTGDGCADGMVALGLLAALDAGERWRASGERRWMVLGALALSFLVGSKNEGLMLALCAVGALMVTGAVRDARAAAGRAGGGAGRGCALLAVWLLVPLSLAAVWALLNARYGFEGDLLGTIDGLSLPARLVQHAPLVLLPLLSWVGSFLLRGGVETHLLFATGLVLLLLFPRLMLWRDALGRSPPYRAVPVALLAALSGYLLIYIGGAPDLLSLREWLRTSFPRVSYHLFPALVVWLGAAVTRLAAAARDPARPT